MKQFKLALPLNFSLAPLRLCVIALIILLSLTTAEAQSTDQNFPTAVTSNEIAGRIPARDIGDSRLTTFYFVFNGNQGDVFINVVTKNLDGDIDVFAANGLRPLTKIRVYSDVPDSETGRIVYLRQPERLILRIEGRTPNDDPATFRIKFAGSFVPLAAVAETENQDQPTVKTENQSDVRVNSVGTIIEVKPKSTPSPAETEKTETIAETKRETKKSETKSNETAADKGKTRKNEEDEREAPADVVTDETTKKSDEAAEKKTAAKTAAKNKPGKKTAKEEKPVEPNPLEKINLVVLFKDGTKIERPMSEVLRVNVDKGVLTVIGKDGTVGRYSILDVAEMTIK